MRKDLWCKKCLVYSDVEVVDGKIIYCNHACEHIFKQMFRDAGLTNLEVEVHCDQCEINKSKENNVPIDEPLGERIVDDSR